MDRILPRHYDGRSAAEQFEALEQRRISRRRALRAGLLGGAAAVAGPMVWRQPVRAAGVPVAGVHLGIGRDARHAMAVSWSTPGAVSGAALDLGPTPAFGLTVPVETKGIAGAPSRYHHARVANLAPGTTYHWRIRHGGGTPVTGTLRAAPAAAEPFRMVLLGDMGDTEGAFANVARITTLRPAPSYVFHVGDLCYASKGGGLAAVPVDQDVWDRWLGGIAPVAARSPWMPTAGNHEIEPGFGPQGYDGFLGRFALPGNGVPRAPHVYAYRWGNVAMVSLDGNDASWEITANRGWTAGAQDRWLDRTLAALRADPAVDFIVVGFHNCMYCTNLVHASDGGNRARWEPLFDRHRVDLVVNGHNHSYERTHPVRAGEPTAEAPRGATVRPAAQGTTYVTAGGGGQAAYPTALHPLSYVVIDGGLRIPETSPWSAVRYLNLSFVVADVEPRRAGQPARMRLTTLATDGTIVDRLTLER